MPEITADVTEVENGVRGIPASEKFTAKRVDHYTLSSGGQLFRVTAYRDADDPLVEAGESIAGELQELDKWDKDRFKFRVSRDAGASSPRGEVHNPPAPASAPSTPPPAAPALSLEETRRWLGMLVAVLDKPGADFEELAGLARAFTRWASNTPAPFSDVPIDESGLPGEKAA